MLELILGQASVSPFSSIPNPHSKLTITWPATWCHDWKAQAKEDDGRVCLSEEVGPGLLISPFIWKIERNRV